MNRTKLILIGAFVLAFGAGCVLGIVLRNVFSKATLPPGPRSWLITELQLTSDQQEKMKQISAEVDAARHAEGEKRTALRKDRDEAVVSLITGEARLKYEAIQKKYQAGMEEMDKHRELNAAFEKAREQLKQLLTPEQAKKYEEMLKQYREQGEGGPPMNEFRGAGRGRGGSRPSSRPTTRAATQPVEQQTISPRVGEQ